MRVKRAIVSVMAAGMLACGVLMACTSKNGGSGGGDDGFSCPTLSNETPDACPSWSGQVEGIVATYCLQCHGEGGIEYSQYNFSTYADVHARYTTMITQVNACSMPPWDASPAAAQPPAEDRQALLSWLECNAPNN